MGNDNGTQQIGAVHDVGRALLDKLDIIEQRLYDLLADREQEPDYDQTFVVGGTLAAASVVVIGNMPRTLKHVELTLWGDALGAIAVFAGNVSLVQAQGMHNVANAAGAISNAICSSGGGKVTVRDYLDSSGYLTVFFVAAYTGFANVRVRQLDETQARGQRT